MTTRFLILALAALALAGCEKSGSNPPNEANPGGASGGAQPGASRPLDLLTRSGVEMVYLPGGQFSMGEERGNPDEAPAHKVRVGAFLMDKCEVTHRLFAQAQLPNPSHWQDNPNKPVERVRWRDAKQYCNERSLLEGLKPCYNEKTVDWDCDYSANGYRLPTEAEWEYACRAGADNPAELSTPDKLRHFAWFADNSGQKTHPVGQKKPNAWGIYDLYGNAAEWCEDLYSPTYYRQSEPADPRGPPNSGKDAKRVIRGGSWKSAPDQCRPAFRQAERTGDSDACFATDYCGFRCVRRVTPAELQQLLASKKP